MKNIITLLLILLTLKLEYAKRISINMEFLETNLKGINSFYKFDNGYNQFQKQKEIIKVTKRELSVFNDTSLIENKGQIETINKVLYEEFLVIDDSLRRTQVYPAIATDTSGNFVIVWQDNRSGIWDIYLQRYNSSGIKQGVNTKVNDDMGSAEQFDPSIAMDVQGNYVVVWTDERNGNKDIFYQLYDKFGNRIGSNKKVNDDQGNAVQANAKAAMDKNGNFVITWMDGRYSDNSIYFQRFNNMGIKLGENTRVNNSLSGSHGPQDVAMDWNGNFTVTWEYNNDILYQRFNNLGLRQGLTLRVNDDPGNATQMLPTIGMDAIGNFIITWMDDRDGNFDIYFQRFNSFGFKQGLNTKVNDDNGMASQWYSSIALDKDGNFIIVWEEYRNNNDIIAQRYFSDGTPRGINYRVVIDSISFKARPKVAANNSKIFFTWMENRNFNGMDIYGKIVDWNWNGIVSSIEEKSKLLSDFILYQNYPNPFNPETIIEFSIPQSSFVTIKVYDAVGNEVAELLRAEKGAGNYKITFDGKNLSSGVYYVKMNAGSYSNTIKMVLMR